MNTTLTPGPCARRRDDGFTMVEILIAIVLVGILSAVVVVGVGSLTDQGSASACTVSADASKAGAMVYYAQNSAYPTTFPQMVSAETLEAPSDVTVAASTLTAQGWTLTIAGGGSTKPTFTCS